MIDNFIDSAIDWYDNTKSKIKNTIESVKLKKQFYSNNNPYSKTVDEMLTTILDGDWKSIWLDSYHVVFEGKPGCKSFKVWRSNYPYSYANRASECKVEIIKNEKNCLDSKTLWNKNDGRASFKSLNRLRMLENKIEDWELAKRQIELIKQYSTTTCSTITTGSQNGGYVNTKNNIKINFLFDNKTNVNHYGAPVSTNSYGIKTEIPKSKSKPKKEKSKAPVLSNEEFDDLMSKLL